MSLEKTTTVDAAVLRDGWAVLSIYQFIPWDELEEPEEKIRQKLTTYFDYVQSPRFLQTMHRAPARIELVSVDPVPDEIAAVCDTFGVEVHWGES